MKKENLDKFKLALKVIKANYTKQALEQLIAPLKKITGRELCRRINPYNYSLEYIYLPAAAVKKKQNVFMLSDFFFVKTSVENEKEWITEMFGQDAAPAEAIKETEEKKEVKEAPIKPKPRRRTKNGTQGKT